MGLRAEKERTREPLSGALPVVACRAATLLLPLLVLLLSASPVAGQRSANARATIHIPTVSHLDVQPVATSSRSASDEPTGTLRVRVRANHEWKVVVAVPFGLERPVWVRTAGDGGSEAYQRLEPGSEAVIAAGGGGATELRLQYLWEGDGTSDVPPLRATLAAARL